LWIKRGLIHFGGDITDHWGGYHRQLGGISPTTGGGDITDEILKIFLIINDLYNFIFSSLARVYARMRQTVLKLVLKTCIKNRVRCGQGMWINNQNDRKVRRQYRGGVTPPLLPP
jgi:hypothetical protein